MSNEALVTIHFETGDNITARLEAEDAALSEQLSKHLKPIIQEVVTRILLQAVQSHILNGAIRAQLPEPSISFLAMPTVIAMIFLRTTDQRNSTQCFCIFSINQCLG